MEKLLPGVRLQGFQTEYNKRLESRLLPLLLSKKRKQNKTKPKPKN